MKISYNRRSYMNWMKPPFLTAHIHSFLNVSEANGPGKRAVIWFQGCRRRCPGCCNPDMQSLLTSDQWQLVDVMIIKRWIMESLKDGIEGITLTGGEPLEQPVPCLDIIEAARGLGLSTVLYTGYEELSCVSSNYARKVWNMSDIVVAGPYRQDSPDFNRPVGSTNKRLIFNSDRYTIKDLSRWGWAEVHVHPGGGIVQTGVMPDLLKSMRRAAIL